MYILGLNTYHSDSSAALIKDGRLVSAVEEERFTRIKHWAGFPRKAIQYCLEQSGIGLNDIDYIAINRNPRARLLKKAAFALKHRPSLRLVRDRLRNWRKIQDIKPQLAHNFDCPTDRIKAKVVNVEHHRAHLASSFCVSEFDEAALVSIDGFGDFTSAFIAAGKDRHIKPLQEINYPHSLGIFYSAFTQFLGFPKFGDEYKVMGLSAFGKPLYLSQMRQILKMKPEGKFELDLSFFQHHTQGSKMQWNNTAPALDRLYSDRLCNLFGTPRAKNEPLTAMHKDIAASVQAAYEQAFFHILRHAHKIIGSDNLCLSGGCALNSLANGKIFDQTPFKEVFIQPAANDGGGALGAAYYLYHHILGKPRTFVMKTAFWGPAYDHQDISSVLEKNKAKLNGFDIKNYSDKNSLVKETAKYLAEGKIVGWFQGQMEWGPRALGNRSILADPRKQYMKNVINSKIKLREPFRPFAPSILEKFVGDYFEKKYPDPFMLKVYAIKPEKQASIPAVTHVDGTGRLQTVNRNENPLYWQLINEFREKTGVPVILNTSFNENEPIVCTPQQALECFIRTRMDVLVLGDWSISRNGSQ